MGGGFTKLLNPLVPLGLGGKGNNSAADNLNSAPVPTPANPVTAANPAVVQAEHDYAMANLLKKSVRKTIVAGDTGGYNPKNPNASPGAEAGYKARL